MLNFPLRLPPNSTGLNSKCLYHSMMMSSRSDSEASANQTGTEYEVAILGAGPIGLEMAVCLKRAGVGYVHFDAHQIGHTMTWWPRNTNFFSTTERLAIG